MAEKYYYDPLSDMGQIKESLMSLFCDTKDITRLVMPKLDHEDFTWEQNWYGGTYEKNIGGQTALTTLPGHCFDTPYIEGILTDDRCALFLETCVTKIANQHIKEVGIDITILCHRDSVRLSEEDREYYHSIGIYGNRVDSVIQAINATLMDPEIMTALKDSYSIGALTFTEENPIKPYIPGNDFYGKCLSYTYQAFYRRKIMQGR